VPGAVLGAILIASLDNGMVLLDVSSPMRQIFIGIVLIVSVWFRCRLSEEERDVTEANVAPAISPTAAGTPLVQVRQLSKHFGGVHAVDHGRL